MPKMLILVACTVLAVGQDVAAHADIGETVEPSKDDALSLARLGRALYLSREDDPTKGELTATSDDKTRAKQLAKLVTDEQTARAETARMQSPAGMAEIVAAAVATAVQAAMSAKVQTSAQAPAA